MNWYVPVRTGTYQYKAVQASTGFPRLVQAGTRQYRISPVWYKSVQDGTTQYKNSSYRWRTVQVSTGFPGSVQNGTRRYKSVHDFSRFCTGQYKSVQDFPNRYKTVQDGTSQYMIYTVTIRTGRYRMVQVSTAINIWYIPVHTGMYWYVLVRTGT